MTSNAKSISKEKARAYHQVQVAKKDGTLLPEPCQKCGKAKVEAHHPDYTRPLHVMWLCHSCHINLHKVGRPKKIRPAKPVIVQEPPRRLKAHEILGELIEFSLICAGKLANRAGIPPFIMLMILNGDVSPNGEQRRAIADALRLPVNSIWREEPNGDAA